MADDATPQPEKSSLRVSPGAVFAVLLGVAFAAFVVQNTADAEVTWLVFDATAPLWLSLVVSAGAGIVLGELVTRSIRRSRSKKK